MIRETKPAPARKAKPLSGSEMLLLAPWKAQGNNTFEAVLLKKPQTALTPLTRLEQAYLERIHGSRQLHESRPQRVKMMLLNGYTVREIAALHRGQDGWGREQVRKDRTALLQAGLKLPK